MPDPNPEAAQSFKDFLSASLNQPLYPHEAVRLLADFRRETEEVILQKFELLQGLTDSARVTFRESVDQSEPCIILEVTNGHAPISKRKLDILTGRLRPFTS